MEQGKTGTLSKGKDPFVKITLKREVEELVREASEVLGLWPATTRNLAVLYGLVHLLTWRQLPTTDRQYLEVFEELRRTILRLIELHGEEQNAL